MDDVSDDDNDAGEGTGSFPVTQIIDDLFCRLSARNYVVATYIANALFYL